MIIQKPLLASIFGILLATQSIAADFPSQVTLKIGGEVGSGRDTLGRIIASHLPKYLPQSPQINVENVAGAGGLILTRKLSETEPKDGSVIGLVQMSAIRNYILDPKSIPNDPAKLNWIGSFSTPTMICAARKQDVGNIDLVNGANIKMPQSSIGGISHYTLNALKKLRLKDIQLITGMKNEVEQAASVDRGETNTICGFSLQSYHRLGLDDRMQIIGTTTPDKTFQDNGVPYFLDGLSEADRRAYDILALSERYFYPLTLPVDVSEDIVKIYRKALQDLSRDPDFLADVSKSSFENTFTDGAKLQSVASELLKADAKIVERARELAE